LNDVLNKFVRDRHLNEAEKPDGAVDPDEAEKIGPAGPARAQPDGANPRLLEAFRRDAEKAVAALRETAASGDTKLFATTAHAMKSALAYIGEHKISEMAFALEKAGLDADAGFISANAEGLIKELEALSENLRPAETAAAPGAGAGEDMAYLAEHLETVKTACENYDDAAAYAALDRLNEKPWGAETAAALGQIRDMLFLRSDFEAAAERASEYIRKVIL
jgi:HPt (histidine-containing phosphotransfer) domain-containing protein